MGDAGLGGSFFENLFGDAGFDIFGARGRRRKAKAGAAEGARGKDLEAAVSVTLEEAYRGTEKTITVSRRDSCPMCGGTGAAPGTSKTTCPDCRGSGRKLVSSGIFQMAQPCGRCGGTGSIIQTPCGECGGQGRVNVTRSLSVTIPPGVDTGARLRMKGEGEAGEKGKGDLFLVVEVLAHALFQRQGADLLTELTVSLSRAILGSELSVPTMDGAVVMKIPAGTQSGTVFRLKGKGMPALRGKGVGDELVRVTVLIPRAVSPRQRELIEEFDKEANGARDTSGA
jgi:molecular chaperone DnaJ